MEDLYFFISLLWMASNLLRDIYFKSRRLVQRTDIPPETWYSPSAGASVFSCQPRWLVDDGAAVGGRVQEENPIISTGRSIIYFALKIIRKLFSIHRTTIHGCNRQLFSLLLRSCICFCHDWLVWSRKIMARICRVLCMLISSPHCGLT